jgi:hypothetical protein
LAANGTKKCSSCELKKPVSELSKRHTTPDKLNPSCKACRRNRSIARYGLSRDAYDALVKLQGDKCGICGKSRAEATLKYEDWNIDHDHKSGLVRGLLCGNCNTGLGLSGDDPSMLENAIRYLSQPQPEEEHEV